MASPAVLIFRNKKVGNNTLFSPSEHVLNLLKYDIRLFSRFGLHLSFGYQDNLNDLRKEFKSNSSLWFEFFGHQNTFLFILLYNYLKYKRKVSIKKLYKIFKTPKPVLFRYIDNWIDKTVIKREYKFVKKENNIYVGDKSTILSISGENEKLSSRKRCYFCSYSATSILDENLIYYLEELQKNGFDIVFISTSKDLSEGQKQRLHEYCKIIIHRLNIGHDFGSWVSAIDLFPASSDLDDVLLANDSVVGPLSCIHNVLSLLNKNYDIGGITSSTQIRYHLQSFFLHFNKKVIESGAFEEFWNGYKCVLIKDLVIFDGEIRLSDFFKSRGYKLGALIETHNCFPFLSPGIDPMKSYWRELILDFKIPFIKKSVWRMTLNNKDFHEEVIEVLRQVNPRVLSNIESGR